MIAQRLAALGDLDPGHQRQRPVGDQRGSSADRSTAAPPPADARGRGRTSPLPDRRAARTAPRRPAAAAATRRKRARRRESAPRPCGRAASDRQAAGRTAPDPAEAGHHGCHAAGSARSPASSAHGPRCRDRRIRAAAERTISFRLSPSPIAARRSTLRRNSVGSGLPSRAGRRQLAHHHAELQVAQRPAARGGRKGRYQPLGRARVVPLQASVGRPPVLGFRKPVGTSSMLSRHGRDSCPPQAPSAGAG